MGSCSMAEKPLKFAPFGDAYRGLELMRLSATDYFDPFDKKKRHLAQLRTHFSLLTLEDDVVDSLKPKYWHSDPNWGDIIAWTVIIGFFVWVIFMMLFGG